MISCHCDNGLVYSQTRVMKRTVYSPCPLCRSAEFRVEQSKLKLVRWIVIAYAAFLVVTVVSGVA
jgi:Zn finger protein HypA/HybF involved in hydrogenase expression